MPFSFNPPGNKELGNMSLQSKVQLGKCVRNQRNFLAEDCNIRNIVFCFPKWAGKTLIGYTHTQPCSLLGPPYHLFF